MLVISREKEEQITIGEDIVVKILAIRNSKVKLGISAPVTMSVRRDNLNPQCKVSLAHVVVLSIYHQFKEYETDQIEEHGEDWAKGKSTEEVADDFTKWMYGFLLKGVNPS